MDYILDASSPALSVYHPDSGSEIITLPPEWFQPNSSQSDFGAPLLGPTENPPSQDDSLVESNLKTFLDAFETHCSSHRSDTRLSKVNRDISKLERYRKKGNFIQAYYKSISLQNRIELDFANKILYNNTDALESLQGLRTKALTLDYALAIELAEQLALDASKTGQTGAGSTTFISGLGHGISNVGKRLSRRLRGMHVGGGEYEK
ncbi:hypothetical protein L204_100007 [Cryptococcus depauperatus]